MTPPGLVAPSALTPIVTAQPDCKLLLHDVLASPHRLWIRGRLSGISVGSPSSELPWWKRWWSRPDSVAIASAPLHIEVSGQQLETVVSLDTSGRFDTFVDTTLPSARRGWRVARHRLTFADQTTCACAVVLVPPPAAEQALVVLLPLAFTMRADGAQRFPRSEAAEPMTRLLQAVQRGKQGRQPIYYVAAVPPDASARQAELALAATSLGWPAGHFVMMESPGAGSDALAAGLDGLRRLFAGSLSLLVVNEEPSLEARLELRPAAERAEVRRLVENEDAPVDPASVLAQGYLRQGTRPLWVPRHPVVFCHGMLAMTTLHRMLPEHRNYFVAFADFLRERGVRVLFPQVEPTGGVEIRARQLAEQIRHWTDKPVNLIAHSMGGLDSRYLIAHLGMANRVRSLTTICTPHHGSPVADWFCENFGRRIPLMLALQTLGMNLEGVGACRLCDCRDFNARTPDAPEVRYFSYGAAVSLERTTPFLRRAWGIITPREGPNDGLVSVQSAKWGEYLGTLAVDHFAQTPDGLFTRPGEDFDSLGFFTRLVEDLARRGF